jgi:hypothetical protein
MADVTRRVRAGVVLVGLDGLDLVAGAGVGGDLVDRQAVLGLEAGDDLAVVAPVVRQCDDRQLAFLLGGVDQLLAGAAGARCGGSAG